MLFERKILLLRRGVMVLLEKQNHVDKIFKISKFKTKFIYVMKMSVQKISNKIGPKSAQ